MSEVSDPTIKNNYSDSESTKVFEITTASTKELSAFIKIKYEEWKAEESFVDYELWSTFTEIFKPLRMEQWTKLNNKNRGTLSQLRTVLPNRGVWVDAEAKQDIALFYCSQEQTRGQWSSYEIDLIKESGGSPTYGMLLQVKKAQAQTQKDESIGPDSSISSTEIPPTKLFQPSTAPPLNSLQDYPPRCTETETYPRQFYDSKNNGNSYRATCTSISNHYEGPESKINATKKWNSLNLLRRITSDPQTPTAEHFESFLSKLRKLQYKLPGDQLTEQFLHMKLMTSCREVPACVLACYKPAPDLPTFINDLQNSNWHKRDVSNSPRILLHRPFRVNSVRRFIRENPRSQIRTRENFKRNPGNRTSQGKFWVCKKEGCRSYYHPESEINKARERFHKAADQYLTEYDNHLDSIDEGEDEEHNYADYDNEIYDQLILDVKAPKSSINQQPSESSSQDPTNELFLASTNNAREIALELAKNSFFHSLTNFDYTVDDNKISSHSPSSPNSQNILRDSNHKNKISPNEEVNIESFSNARYSKTKCFGILIDTGAANRSTVGYNQYIAFKNLFDTPLDTSPQFKVDIRFGIGTTTTVGTIHVNTPMGIVDFYVSHSDTPFLLSLADLDKLK
ncbi:hypothetical protein OnM2_043003, partial [Erysiphe neolycopersici]